MPTSSIRNDILTRLATERSVWDALLAEVDPARVDEGGITDQWSFKDVVTHVIGWRQRFVDELAAAVQGTAISAQPWPIPYEPEDDLSPEGDAKADVINAWITERGRTRTWEQVLAQDTLQWVTMETSFTLSPESVLTDPAALPCLGGSTLAEMMTAEVVFAHFHEEHEASMRTWAAAHSRSNQG